MEVGCWLYKGDMEPRVEGWESLPRLVVPQLFQHPMAELATLPRVHHLPDPITSHPVHFTPQIPLKSVCFSCLHHLHLVLPLWMLCKPSCLSSRYPVSSLKCLLSTKTRMRGLPWWSSGEDFAFQCRECRLDPWSGS